MFKEMGIAYKRSLHFYSKQWFFVYDIIYEWIFALPKYFKKLSIILLFLLTSSTHRLWSIEHKKSVRAFNLYGYNTYEIVTFSKLADCWLLADGARRFTAQGEVQVQDYWSMAADEALPVFCS